MKEVNTKQKGFSLVEVLIAMMIVMVGLLALSGALLIGITLPGRARKQEIAKYMAMAIMESIIAAKESPREGFPNFQSLSNTAGGRFDNGNFHPMFTAGPDGVYGTCDDGSTTFNCSGGGVPAGSSVVRLSADPGSDGQYDSNLYATSPPPNDLIMVLSDFTRRVTITDTTETFGSETRVVAKDVTVEVRYGTPSGIRETITLRARLTDFSRLQ
ncbi:MAG: prepilin-type N-terminal cleavage/methylation domain-containing protein [Acidobacteriota bacterium]|nr:prepilin-type N-terminal cleavage/methylation domain-containing protein [Blastocatellia bacterium]MDW8411822.1 prepilin-type N-terminal cleavage/methylation domain-containing protein [Acidobacteriota bacterium]